MKAARPITVAFSSYRYVESFLANVNKLRYTNYSVNRDFSHRNIKGYEVTLAKTEANS